MKLITMTAVAAGPEGSMAPGKTYPVDDKTAADLIRGGYAVYAQGPEPLEDTTKPREPETATKKTVEQTTSTKKKRTAKKR